MRLLLLGLIELGREMGLEASSLHAYQRKKCNMGVKPKKKRCFLFEVQRKKMRSDAKYY